MNALPCPHKIISLWGQLTLTKVEYHHIQQILNLIIVDKEHYSLFDFIFSFKTLNPLITSNMWIFQSLTALFADQTRYIFFKILTITTITASSFSRNNGGINIIIRGSAPLKRHDPPLLFNLDHDPGERSRSCLISLMISLLLSILICFCKSN